MKKYMFIFIQTSLLFIIGCTSIQTPQKGPIQLQREQTDQKNRELFSALHQGGHIIFLRHSKTDWTQKDIEPYDFDDCSKQRNLSPGGRDRAVRIGEALKALNVPIGEVRTSPLCRCIETAELAFGRYVIDYDLSRPPKQDAARREYLQSRMPELLAEVPPPGVNLVYVGHTVITFDIYNFSDYSEGSMLIFKPDGEGSYQMLGLIPPDELFALVE